MSERLNTYYKQKKRTVDTKTIHDSVQEKILNTSSDLQTLEKFDLDYRFGPCAGITRIERWERAKMYGLEPPLDVFEILRKHIDEEEYQQSLWYEYDM